MTERQPFSATEYDDGDLFAAYYSACPATTNAAVRYNSLEEPQGAYSILSGADFNRRQFPFRLDALLDHLEVLHENDVNIPPFVYQQESLGAVAIRASYITSEFTDGHDAIGSTDAYQQMATLALPGLERYIDWCRETQSPAILNALFELRQYRYGTVAEDPAAPSSTRWWLTGIDASTSPYDHVPALIADLNDLRKRVEANS